MSLLNLPSGPKLKAFPLSAPRSMLNKIYLCSSVRIDYLSHAKACAELLKCEIEEVFYLSEAAYRKGAGQSGLKRVWLRIQLYIFYPLLLIRKILTAKKGVRFYCHDQYVLRAAADGGSREASRDPSDVSSLRSLSRCDDCRRTSEASFLGSPNLGLPAKKNPEALPRHRLSGGGASAAL